MLTPPPIYRAELGRASWKLFHTVLARFPETPTHDESEALRAYIHLFQRLYPWCVSYPSSLSLFIFPPRIQADDISNSGECAEHFGTILSKFPPQTSSRSAAAVWGCHVHNEVNKRLNKALFDCNNIGDFYKCGCEEGDGGSSSVSVPPSTSTSSSASASSSASPLATMLGIETDPEAAVEASSILAIATAAPRPQ